MGWETEVGDVLAAFGGVVPLFPLPETVFFPRTVLLLHIFEPRYREMLSHALDGDQLLAPVLLRPGYESDYEGRPSVHAVTSMGKVARAVRFPDGRANIALVGLTRVRIVEELPPDQSFRLARVEVIAEDETASLEASRPALAGEIDELVKALPQQHVRDASKLELASTDGLALGTIVDLTVDALDLPADERQLVLETIDQVKRAEIARRAIQRLASGGRRPFPPEPSRN